MEREEKRCRKSKLLLREALNDMGCNRGGLHTGILRGRKIRKKGLRVRVLSQDVNGYHDDKGVVKMPFGAVGLSMLAEFNSMRDTAGSKSTLQRLSRKRATTVTIQSMRSSVYEQNTVYETICHLFRISRIYT